MKDIKDMKKGDPRIKGSFTWMYRTPFWLFAALWTVGWGIFQAMAGHWIMGTCLALSQSFYFTQVFGFEIWKDWLNDVYGEEDGTL